MGGACSGAGGLGGHGHSGGPVLFLVQRPATLESVVLVNAFARTLSTSITEVVACWAVVGATALRGS